MPPRAFPATPRARYALLALLFLFYFGSLAVAAHFFPRAYDWRSNVMSNLLSPRDNPHYYWIASLGMALAGLCMAPLFAWIDDHLGEGRSRRLRQTSFLGGAGCLVLAALVVPRHAHPLFGMPRLHETLARTSALGVGTGMLCASWSALFSPNRESPGARQRLRIMGATWALATLGPVAGLLLSELLLLLARISWFPHGADITQALRGTLWWHLAFWEWFGSAVTFCFLASSVVWLPPREQRNAVR